MRTAARTAGYSWRNGQAARQTWPSATEKIFSAASSPTKIKTRATVLQPKCLHSPALWSADTSWSVLGARGLVFHSVRAHMLALWRSKHTRMRMLQRAHGVWESTLTAPDPPAPDPCPRLIFPAARRTTRHEVCRTTPSNRSHPQCAGRARWHRLPSPRPALGTQAPAAHLRRKALLSHPCPTRQGTPAMFAPAAHTVGAGHHTVSTLHARCGVTSARRTETEKNRTPPAAHPARSRAAPRHCSCKLAGRAAHRPSRRPARRTPGSCNAGLCLCLCIATAATFAPLPPPRLYR